MFLKSGRNKVSRERNSQFFRSIARGTTVVSQHYLNRNKRCVFNPNNEFRLLFSSVLPSRQNNEEESNLENRFSIPEKNDSPIDFAVSSKIEGEESQIATIKLIPGEKLRAESGSMLFMTQGIEMATNLDGGASSAFRRMMTGQNIFLTDFIYNGTKDKDGGGSGSVALGTDFPSKIVRLSLDDYGGSLIAQRGAYLASNASVDIQMEFTKTMTAGFFGGQGFILQRLLGEGDVLIKAGGTLVERFLKDGEVLRASSGSIVAFETTVSYDIQMMQGVKNVMFGGEGLFLTTLKGPGRIWLQGMPPDRMIAEIASRVPSGGGFGPVLPIPMGGTGSGVEGAPVDAGVSNGAEGDTNVDVGEDEAAAMDEGVNIESEAMSTVSSSGTMDGDSSTYSNTISEGDNFQETTFTDDAFQETTFTDEETDFTEPSFSGDTSFNSQNSDEAFGQQGGDFFEDDNTEIFDTGNIEEASEAGSKILSTLWDIFTGGD
jgi:uncharacterized protein (TIGR00266 family)